MNRRGEALVIGLAVLILGVIIGGILAFSSFYATHSGTITVKDKHMDYSGGETASTSYVVVSTDGRLWEVEVPFWDWNANHNPDRVYAKLTVGKTYDILWYGWSVENPLFYWYNLILEANEV